MPTSPHGGFALHRFSPSRLMRPMALASIVALMAAPASAATGPSSSATPYVVPVAPGVQITAILTVGDTIDGYPMIGLPDGLGTYPNGDGTFTMLMNHELPAGTGGVHAHGANGAFVSRWTVNGQTFAVSAGGDLIGRVATWNAATGSYNAAALGVVLARLCSADLATLSAFYNAKSKQGYDGRIFMNGEEVGTEGRAFAHLLDGTSYELPRLGKLSWENSVANPATGNRTVVIGTDDSTPGEVYVYVGHKTKKGNPVDRAGLTNGSLYGIAVTGVAAEDRFTGIGGTSGRFTLAPFGDVSSWTGAQLQAASTAGGTTQFLRPEDGAWDPTNPDDFYFVTTDRFDPDKSVQDANDGRSRLWRLRFDSVKDPEAGGMLEMLVDGTEPHQMFDNITIDSNGHVLIQEDPGNQPYLARIWQYTIASDALTVIAQLDPARFQPGTASPLLTQDEESSGIVDASASIGPGWFLLDVQAHYPNGLLLVEGGQLLALYNPDSDWTR